MKCDTCEYDTETQIPAGSTAEAKVQLYGIHVSIKHTQATGRLTAEDSRNKVKFPKPGIDQAQPLEEWETFLTRWAEYKKQMKVLTTNVAGQLISCASNELETSLQRILGKELYNKT